MKLLSRTVWVGVGLLFISTSLSACSEARKSFGLDRTTPDEFAVVSHAALTLPPDYTLHPPRPGAPRPQEPSMQDQAAVTVLGQRPTQASRPSSQAESNLLVHAGAQNADPRIRTMVDEESATLTEAQESFVDDLLFWKRNKEPGTPVDAKAESKRLRQNTALQRPVTEGSTPVQGKGPAID